jgi:hypothetical protein
MAIENIKIANGTAVPVKDVEAHSLISSLTSTVSSLASTVDGKPTFANIPNRNLLDNWYFADPVNQRGKTSYSNGGFGIDRWKMSSSGYTLTLNDGYMSVAAGDSDLYFMQTLSNFDWTKTYTLSVMTSDGSIHSKKGTYAVGFNLPVGTYVYTTYSADTGLFKVNFKFYSGVTTDLIAVKLEYGSVSTLANDAPPKKSEQLLECQRYYVQYSNDSDAQFAVGGTMGTAVYTTVYLPTQMYGTAAATVTFSNVDIWPFISGGSEAATSVDGYLTGSRQACIVKASHAASSNLPAKSPATIRIKAGGYIAISCEL